MAKEIRTVLVKGKYAEAINKGAKTDAKVKELTAKLKDYKNLLQDKTIKVDETEQSIRLRAEKTDVTALLTIRRNAKINPTEELKDNIRKGMYSGVLSVERTIKLNPADVEKAVAFLNAAGIKAEDVWNINAKASDLDKYRDENGSDTVLGDAYSVEEVYAVKF